MATEAALLLGRQRWPAGRHLRRSHEGRRVGRQAAGRGWWWLLPVLCAARAAAERGTRGMRPWLSDTELPFRFRRSYVMAGQDSMSPVTINGFPLDGKRVFVIAEIGNNHNGSVELARRLVDASIAAGADAV